MSKAKLDLTVPPFAVGNGTAPETGRQIADLYAALEENPLPVNTIWNTVTKAAGLDKESPIFKAGGDIAHALDAGRGTGIQGGYHNTQHYIEVLLNTAYLVARNAAGTDGISLTQHEKTKLLFSALIHDFYYEPGGNVINKHPVPYRLEEIALIHAKPFMDRHGMTPNDSRDVGVMVYCTDVSPASKAGGFMRLVHKALFDGALMPDASSLLGRIKPIFERPRLARMAAMLGDADIVSSAGLTSAYCDRLSAKLGQEVYRPMGPKETLGFLAHVANNEFTTPEAKFLQPNMDAIRYKAFIASAPQGRPYPYLSAT